MCRASAMAGISPEVCCSQAQRGSPMPLIKLQPSKKIHFQSLRGRNLKAAAETGLASQLSNESMKTQPLIVTAVIRELVGLYLEMNICLLLERERG